MAKPTTLNKIWAQTGVVVAPTDSYISIGWTLDIPPYEYFNYAFNKWDYAACRGERRYHREVRIQISVIRRSGGE